MLARWKVVVGAWVESFNIILLVLTKAYQTMSKKSLSKNLKCKYINNC